MHSSLGPATKTKKNKELINVQIIGSFKKSMTTEFVFVMEQRINK